jgi:hypothetical protein
MAGVGAKIMPSAKHELGNRAFLFGLSRTELAVLLFTLGYMSAAGFAAIRRQNSEFVLYLVVMTSLIAVVAAVHFHVRLHWATLWGLSLWGLAHMCGGLVSIPMSWPVWGESHVLYNLWLLPGLLKYDQLVHAFGFGIVTWVCWQGIRGAFARHRIAARPSWGLLAICISGGMGFGALNELIEFVATLTMPGTNVGGYLNTGWDLLANFVGCTVTALVIRAHWRMKRSTANGASRDRGRQA